MLVSCNINSVGSFADIHTITVIFEFINDFTFIKISGNILINFVLRFFSKKAFSYFYKPKKGVDNTCEVLFKKRPTYFKFPYKLDEYRFE